MSRAWPLFQVHLRGAFDHDTDLNDRQVIERGNRGVRGMGRKNDHPSGCRSGSRMGNVGGG